MMIPMEEYERLFPEDNECSITEFNYFGDDSNEFPEGRALTKMFPRAEGSVVAIGRVDPQIPNFRYVPSKGKGLVIVVKEGLIA